MASNDNPQLSYRLYFCCGLPDEATEVPAGCLDAIIRAGYSPMMESSLRRHDTMPTLRCGCAMWWSYYPAHNVDDFNRDVAAPVVPPTAVYGGN